MNKLAAFLVAAVAAAAVMWVAAWMYGRSLRRSASKPPPPGRPDVRTVRHGTVSSRDPYTGGKFAYTITSDLQEVPCAKGVKGPCSFGSSWTVKDDSSTPNVDVLRRVGVNGRVTVVLKNGKLESIAEEMPKKPAEESLYGTVIKYDAAVSRKMPGSPAGKFTIGYDRGGTVVVVDNPSTGPGNARADVLRRIGVNGRAIVVLKNGVVESIAPGGPAKPTSMTPSSGLIAVPNQTASGRKETFSSDTYML